MSEPLLDVAKLADRLESCPVKQDWSCADDRAFDFVQFAMRVPDRDLIVRALRLASLRMEREEVGRKVMEQSQLCAEGYRRNISQFNTASENDAAEKCATAASNTGWFILQVLGFAKEEIRALFNAYHAAEC